VQAQDYPNAKWAVAQRTRDATDADIERAVAEGAILRTHVLRPTWHFILPQDARWMLQLTAPRVSAAMGYYNRQLGFDRDAFNKSNRALERALRDGQHLTRRELAAVLGRAGLDVSTGQRVGHLLMQAELEGVVISGARRGKQFTYALFDARVPPAAQRDRDDALQDLARRYFTTRGPATAQDFAWWSGLTVSDAKRGAEAAGSSLRRETHDGRTYWSGAKSAPMPRTHLAHLLPNYDELFIGFRDRSAFGARLHAAAADHRVDGLMGHILFIDGQIVGGWRRTPRAGVALQALVPMTRAERGLVSRALERFGAFLGEDVEIATGSFRGKQQKRA
jgi:hypothetical protein